MSKLNVIVTTVDTAAMISDQLYPATGGSVSDSIDRLSRYFQGLANGNFYFTTITEQIGALQATGLLTSTGTATAAQTVSVANVTLTAVASGANPVLGQWNVSATVGTQAASIALAINSIPTLVGIVTATSNAGVVTILSSHASISSNGLQLSSGATNVTATAFSGGTNGTATTLR